MSKNPTFHFLFLATLVSVAAGCAGEFGAETPDDVEVETSALTSTTTSLWIHQVLFYGIYDPTGDPEMFVKCRTSSGKTGRKDLPTVNEMLYTYTPNEKIMDVPNADTWITCELWEDDSTSGDEYVGETTITMADLNKTNQEACTGIDSTFLTLGFSKNKATNLCPEQAVNNYYCNVPCKGWTYLR